MAHTSLLVPSSVSVHIHSCILCSDPIRHVVAAGYHRTPIRMAVMSKNINGIPAIYAENDNVCELCGKIAECRPYGPKGELICWECGQKDKKTKRQPTK